MTDNASRILDAALQLPEAERAELAAILIDSIGEEIEASWCAEAKRRLAAYHCGEIDLEPEAPSASRHPPETEDAYRARLIAKIERGIADMEAGRGVPHAEVMAQLEARYGSEK